MLATPILEIDHRELPVINAIIMRRVRSALPDSGKLVCPIFACMAFGAGLLDHKVVFDLFFGEFFHNGFLLGYGLSLHEFLSNWKITHKKLLKI
jgi:hypothetical protein